MNPSSLGIFDESAAKIVEGEAIVFSHLVEHGDCSGKVISGRLEDLLRSGMRPWRSDI